MKIVIAADSHGNSEALRKVALANGDADMFIHLGDGEREYDELYTLFPGECRYVRGNNDYNAFVSTQVFKAGGHKFYATHGHTLDVKSGLDSLCASAAANNCDIALFGHTHIKHLEQRNGIYLFNPGSCSCPMRAEAPTYGVVIFKEGEPLFSFHEV